MEDLFLPVDGEIAVPADLSCAKARNLALRLADETIPHASLVECRRRGVETTVVFDLEVEVPNHRMHDIRRCERIAATFVDDDTCLPRVRALRADFPVVPHLNMHLQSHPRDLCIYEERYDELKRSWTAPRFIRRLRQWLALTATDDLHQDDQRLEPLLVDYAGHIVLPPDIATDRCGRLFVTSTTGAATQERWFLLTHRQQPSSNPQAPTMVMSVHRCRPQTHGLIHRCPRSLADVAAITAPVGVDLIAEVRIALDKWKEVHLDSLVVLTVVLPKTRNDGGPVEDHEIWCFALESSVRQLGTALGLWQEVDGQLGAVLGDRDDTKGQDISVAVLNPCFALTRDDAARLNGRPVCDARVAGIGVGALGSQIVLNLARAGFGKWTLIDHDRLMPHNLARHALNGNFVGWNKADTVAYCADSITVEDNVFASLDADILRPGTKSEEVAATLTSAEVIADMTASVAAQRYLTRDVNSSARRLSIFLNPSGSDLVIIAEDAARKFPLDSLEMQYYRTLLHDTELAEHLGAPGVTQRYARSCGDTTSAIPQDFVGLHAAVASRALKDILSDSHPFVGIWRASADATVRRVNVDVAPVIEFHFNDWTVVLDRGLIDQLKRSREERLPNETGGVLLGSFDLQRRVLYVVDTLPSPPDSRERADLYIRGCEGLPKALEDAEARTAGMLEYIGEWHSHPAGASTKPSEYDLAAFSWLTKLMANDGLPAAMLIVGDTEIGLFIDSMGDEASPIPEEGRGKVLA